MITTPPNKQDELKTLYDQLCTSYHRVDDFRAKLLGLLPLVSGVAIFELLKNPLIWVYLPMIGSLGAFTALGLLIYELKGIQKCTGYIEFGQKIEQALFRKTAQQVGHFGSLSKVKPFANIFSEPVASAFVYSAVIGAWVYVATTVAQFDEDGTIKGYAGHIGGAIVAAILVFAGVLAFWLFILKLVKKSAG